jgi:hypothetical protein
MTWARQSFAVLVGVSQLHPVLGRLTCGARKLKKVSRIAAVFLLILSAVPARAGCDEDCKGEYVFAVDECRSDYEQGSRNVQELELCLADTRNEYEDCVDDCTALGAGGLVAGTSVPLLSPAMFTIR